MAARLPSAAVLAARSRRGAGAAASQVRIDWFIKKVSRRVDLTMRQRMKIAVAFLADRIVRNISRPVTKGTGPFGGRAVTNRSKPGEFPKADTTQLMKTIFTDVRNSAGGIDGFVATPLEYGLILETQLDRSFFVRTLREEHARITSILTGPIR